MQNMEAAGINRRLAINVTDSVRLRMKKYTSATPNENGCLLWSGSERNGYGAIKIEHRVYGAHCVAFAVAGGVITEGCVIAHKCDVKLCVNPDHLECVSVQKNNQDMQTRRPRPVCSGSELPYAILSEELVFKILDMHKPRSFGYRKVASSLGVSEHAVKGVVCGTNWAKEKAKYYAQRQAASVS